MARPNVFFVMLLLLVEGKNCVERSESAVVVAVAEAAADVSGKRGDMIHAKSEINAGAPGDEQWNYDDDSEDSDDENDGWSNSAIDQANQATKLSTALRLAATLTETVEGVGGFLESIEAASHLGKVMKIGSALSPLIPGYGIIFKLGDKALSTNEQMEALKKGFADVHKTSVGLNKRVKDLNKLVDSNLIYHLLSKLKENIMYISDLVNKWILAGTDEEKNYFEKEIISEYKEKKGIVHLENLYYNLIGQVGVVKEDIMWNVNRASDCHVGTLERYGEVLLRLLVEGITNHQAYMKFTDEKDEDIEQFQTVWSKRLDDAAERVNSMVGKCSVDVLHFARKDIQEVLQGNHLENHKQLSIAILKKLKSRTNSYKWLVVVFDKKNKKYVGVKGDHFFEDTCGDKKIVVVFKDQDTIENMPDLDCALLATKLETKWFKVATRLEAVYSIPGVSTAVVMNRKGGFMLFHKSYPAHHSSNIPEKKYCFHYDQKPGRYAGWIA